MTGETRKLAATIAFFLLLAAALVFVPAGTLDYWQAWLFLALYAAATVAVTVDVARTAPDLLRRRARGGPFAEPEPRQKIVMALASAGFAALFVVPGLDRRFGWSHVPTAIVLAGDALHLVGWAGIVAVFRGNRFAGATVTVENGQKVVETGLYAYVRHPMYATAFAMLAGMPLALASWWGLAAVAALVPVIVWRLLDEERVLAERLEGYRAYMAKVRWRLVPGVW